jgi:hypothetical protein
MRKYKETWFSSISTDSLTIPKKKTLVKYIKIAIGILLIGAFSLLATSPTQTSEHSFYINSTGTISNNISQKDAAEKNLELVASREKTSFLNLSAGCVGKTEWVYPATGIPVLTAENSIDTEYLVSRDWASIPPVRGDHSLEPNIPTQRFSPQGRNEGEPDWLSYSDALNLLYQGHYIIWYNPELIGSDPSTYNQMSNYILDKILLEEPTGPKYYLAALPEYRLKELPRSIYFTKLNYTQSCAKFKEEIFDNFYE